MFQKVINHVSLSIFLNYIEAKKQFTYHYLKGKKELCLQDEMLQYRNEIVLLETINGAGICNKLPLHFLKKLYFKKYSNN